VFIVRHISITIFTVRHILLFVIKAEVYKLIFFIRGRGEIMKTGFINWPMANGKQMTVYFLNFWDLNIFPYYDIILGKCPDFDFVIAFCLLL